MARNGNGVAARLRVTIVLCSLGNVIHAAQTDAAPPLPPQRRAGQPSRRRRPLCPPKSSPRFKGASTRQRRGRSSLSKTAPGIATIAPTSLIFKAIAERLSGQRDMARETLRKTIAGQPRWALGPKDPVRAGGHRAGRGQMGGRRRADASRGRPPAGRTRKDQLAGVYQAFAQKLLEPGDPLVRPDPNAAYELLVQARELAESPASARPASFRDGPRQPRGRESRPARSRTSSNISRNTATAPTGSRSGSSSAKPSARPISSCRPG